MSAGYAFDWDGYWREQERDDEWWHTAATREDDR